MTPVSGTTDAAVIAALQAAQNGGAAAASNPVEDVQTRFLTLLVKQMQSQDPLNPMDNAEVTSQLAQLNTASGISQLNQTMQGLAASFAATQVLQSGALIGRDVMLGGSTLALAGGQAVFGASLAQPADNLTVEILDASGNVVHRASAGPQAAGLVALHWDGELDAGGTAADGAYRFRLAATAGGQSVDATPLSVARVLSVSTAGGVSLNLSTGASAALGDIQQIL